MRRRWAAFLLALAVVGVPSWLAVQLAGAAAPAAGEDAVPVLASAAVRAGTAMEAALSAAEPLDAAVQQLRDSVDETVEKALHSGPPADIDLSWWQARYPDIIGYVYCPGTPISYPIAYDGNNEYYLHHDLDGNYSEYGTIFLDARAPRDFSAQCNMLYGHHMKDRTMFASIDGYKEQWYYDAHPCLYVYTNAGTYRVDLFAGLIVPGEHEVFNTSFQTVNLERFISQSTFYAGRGIPTGRIVGLCTCSYEADNYRYVVLGEMTLIAEG